jgi:hypothetical protein
MAGGRKLGLEERQIKRYIRSVKRSRQKTRRESPDERRSSPAGGRPHPGAEKAGEGARPGWCMAPTIPPVDTQQPTVPDRRAPEEAREPSPDYVHLDEVEAIFEEVTKEEDLLESAHEVVNAEVEARNLEAPEAETPFNFEEDIGWTVQTSKKKRRGLSKLKHIISELEKEEENKKQAPNEPAILSFEEAAKEVEAESAKSFVKTEVTKVSEDGNDSSGWEIIDVSEDEVTEVKEAMTEERLNSQRWVEQMNEKNRKKMENIGM